MSSPYSVQDVHDILGGDDDLRCAPLIGGPGEPAATDDKGEFVLRVVGGPVHGTTRFRVKIERIPDDA